MLPTNLQLLKGYYQDLPWYKKILFPWGLQLTLKKNELDEEAICQAFNQATLSWSWPFFNWLFPDLYFFSTYKQNFNLSFSDCPVAELSPKERELKILYEQKNQHHPNRAVSRAVRTHLKSIKYWPKDIKISEWPRSFFLLEEEKLLTPSPNTGYLSNQQDQIIQSVMKSPEPYKTAEIALAIQPLLEALPFLDRHKVEKVLSVPLELLLELPSYVSLEQGFNFFLKIVGSRFNYPTLSLNAAELNDEARLLLALLKQLNLLFDHKDDLNLALAQLENSELRGNLLYMNSCFIDLLRFKRRLTYTEGSRAVFGTTEELIEKNKKLLEPLKPLLTGSLGKYVFLILTKPPTKSEIETIRILSKLFSLSSISSAQKEMFCQHWIENVRFADSSRTYFFPIYACLNLFEQLNLTDKPISFKKILDHNDPIYLYLVGQLLKKLNETQIESSQLQVHFNLLMAKECIDDAITYITPYLKLNPRKLVSWHNEIKTEEIFARIILSRSFDHESCSAALFSFIDKNKDKLTDQEWFSLLTATFKFSQSPLITKINQYDIRASYLNLFFNLCLKSDVSLALTILNELDRLSLSLFNNQHFTTQTILPKSMRSLAYLEEVLIQCFKHNFVDWNNLRPGQISQEQFQEVIHRCHANYVNEGEQSEDKNMAIIHHSIESIRCPTKHILVIPQNATSELR